MTPDEREEIFEALLGPMKLDSSVASGEIADMIRADVRKLEPVIERMKLATFKQGYGAGLRVGVRVARQPENLVSSGQILERLLRKRGRA